MNYIKTRNTVLSLVIVVLLILTPVFIDNLYYIGTLSSILINVLLVASFWLIFTTGQVNLGHAAFAAIGAYISAALIKSAGFSAWASLPIGILSAGFVALILGFITLRITGPYFFIVTIAFGEIVRLVFGMIKVPFGGLTGILYIPAPDPISFFGLFQIEFTSKIAIYYLTLFFVLLGVFIVYRVHKSSLGLIFRGMSNSNKLAEHVGINLMKYKVIAFVIGCMCAGLAGILYTFVTTAIQPTTYTTVQSLNYIVWSAVGGMAYFPGPIIGAVVLGIISEFLRPIKEFEPIINGTLLISAILLFRGGIFGLFRLIGTKFAGLIKKD